MPCLRHLAQREIEWGNLACWAVGELHPLHKRLSGHRQFFPVLWAAGDAALERFLP